MDALERGDQEAADAVVETHGETELAARRFSEPGADLAPGAAPSAAAPSAAPAAPVAAAGAPTSPGALEGVVGLRDTIFEKLVTHENDVIGLLAYSLSMQNKRDWLFAFQSEKGRDPTPAEMAAYDIGERIERRLGTYRKLAENALAGNASWASTATTPVSELPGTPATGSFQATVAPAAAPPAPAPAAPPFLRSTSFGDAGGKLALAGGVFVILVAVAFAARHMIGV
jgi:hypothetical protein